MTASLRKPPHDRRPQGTDTHSQRPRSQTLFDASPPPSARRKEGLRSERFRALQGTPSPPPRPTAKKITNQTNPNKAYKQTRHNQPNKQAQDSHSSRLILRLPNRSQIQLLSKISAHHKRRQPPLLDPPLPYAHKFSSSPINSNLHKQPINLKSKTTKNKTNNTTHIFTEQKD